MSTCRCETLPADFGVGIAHARRCPAGHAYAPRPGLSLVAKPCERCARPMKEHPATPTPDENGDNRG